MEEIEWLKLPQDLQHEFFRLAEDESRRIAPVVEELRRRLAELRKELLPLMEPLPSTQELSWVAAVDGSRSPRLSERLGLRCGVFTVGATLLRGLERKDEFRAGVFKRRQALSAERSRYFFELLMSAEERKLALEMLSRADLVILDGSFQGFMYPVNRMKKEGLFHEQEHRVLREAYDATLKLLKSGRAIGVIKRSHTRAIGGYLALRNSKDPLALVIDKLTLSYIMPPGSFFDYSKLLREGVPVPVYTHVARWAQQGSLQNQLPEGAGEKGIGITPEQVEEAVLRRARETVYEPFRSLDLDSSEFEGLKRLQVRAYPYLPPCEIEYPSSLGRERLLELLGQPHFFNEGTNLPLALDLVDSVIGLTAKFTDEFVGEIEGRVLELAGKDRGSQEAIRIFFSLLNPQKPF